MRGSVRQEGQELLSDLLLGAASRWPERVLLTRDQPDRPLEWTYRTFRERVEAIAVGLLDAGLRPGERVALFADNGRRWLETDQALALAGLVSVARGTDTAPAELALILEHSGARGVVLPSAERLDLVPESRRRARLSIFTLESGGPLRSNDELAERGKALLSAGRGRAMLEAARVDPGSTATIVYTSGTTGKPKGVMLSHANIRSNVAASNAVLSFTSGELCLSILPAWHMFERILEYVAIHSGCRLVYSDQRRLKDDMRTERPHAVAFVPRIWESIAAGIQDRLESLPPWRRRLVQPVLAWGRRLAREPGNPLFDGVHRGLSKILLRRLWRALGGRLRLGVSGGGSLPEDVDLLLLSLGMPLLNGYGLTETSPVVCVRRASANRAGSVGRPLPGTELRIVREDGSEADQGVLGEVWIRGPQVMQGYYRDEELTREALTDDGWFRSGDLGRLDPDGSLSISGRSKDTIVLAGGENVEPESIESKLRTSPFIKQVMLVGQDRKVLGALVVPERDALPPALAGAAQGPKLHLLMRQEMDRLLTRSEGFRAMERVGPFATLEEPFEIHNDCLTPTLKLRRGKILERYRTTIDEIYRRG